MAQFFKIDVDISTYMRGELYEMTRDSGLDGVAVIGIRNNTTGDEVRCQMVGEINTIALAEAVHRLFDNLENGPALLALVALNRLVRSGVNVEKVLEEAGIML